MAKSIDRSKVEQFFTWQMSRWKLKWGCLVVVLGALGIAGAFVADIDPIYGIVLTLIGAGLLLLHFKGPNRFGQLYQEFVRAKQHDITHLLERSYRRINIDIDDLLNFDADDLIDFELEGGEPGLFEKLHAKSVLLYGPPEEFDKIKFVKAGNRLLVEFNPLQISVLFLTRDRLITYDANLDLTRGDLNAEAIDHIFLRDVVQVGTATTSERLSRKDFPKLFEDFEKTSGKSPNEIVRRRHTVRISKTDGHSIVLPIGAPEHQDGSTGSLDSGPVEENRYTRIAHQMSARIQDAKAA